ncbi:Pr6Pr family membrane protein [Microbacterium sp. EST19A]|uniref:Pr6Pr family membrane protein n=1 Tax=Microbacterium sp. EST19A TaxID=2862681 RepID=UPI001CBB25E2|nr:Pr6Pr family membrane protein [Microbacterium sp. EST19A]
MASHSGQTPEPRVSAPRLLAHAALNARPIALVYRLLALAAIVTGIVRYSDILTGQPDGTTLLFYTMLSNLICLTWMLLLIIRTVRDLRRRGPSGTSTPNARWSGAVMMAITVTMLIYLVVLVPTRIQDGDSDIFSLTDTLIHVVTPCLLIVDWLFFVPKGAFRRFDPLLWTLLPYTYLLFAFIFGAAGGEFTPGQRYPYPFMDVETLGLQGVALWIVALTIALIAVGYVYLLVDRVLASIAGRSVGDPSARTPRR